MQLSCAPGPSVPAARIWARVERLGRRPAQARAILWNKNLVSVVSTCPPPTHIVVSTCAWVKDFSTGGFLHYLLQKGAGTDSCCGPEPLPALPGAGCACALRSTGCAVGSGAGRPLFGVSDRFFGQNNQIWIWIRWIWIRRRRWAGEGSGAWEGPCSGPALAPGGPEPGRSQGQQGLCARMRPLAGLAVKGRPMRGRIPPTSLV